MTLVLVCSGHGCLNTIRYGRVDGRMYLWLTMKDINTLLLSFPSSSIGKLLPIQNVNPLRF